MKRMSAMLLPLSLSACWSGNGFYATSDAVQAIPAGKYEALAIGGDLRDLSDQADADFGKRMRVRYQADGQAVVEDTSEGDENSAILAKLGDQPGLYVAQVDLGAAIPKIGSSVYALVNVTPEGYQLSVPKCDEKRIGSSRIVTSGLLVGKPVCRFDNRGELETALLEYARDPIRWIEYRRVEKRRKGG